MSDTESPAATRQDLLATAKLLLGIAAFAMMLLAVTFGIGACFLATTQESRGGVGLCVVFAIASGTTALVALVARDDPHLRP
jgi:hypothetical protein